MLLSSARTARAVSSHAAMLASASVGCSTSRSCACLARKRRYSAIFLRFAVMSTMVIALTSCTAIRPWVDHPGQDQLRRAPRPPPSRQDRRQVQGDLLALGARERQLKVAREVVLVPQLQ